MASVADSAGQKFVEGYIDGKPLKDLTASTGNTSAVQDHKLAIKEADNKLSKDVNEAMLEMQTLQQKLNSCNEQFVEQRRKLNEMHNQHSVELSTDQKQTITKDAVDAMDMFMTRRPRKDDDVKAVDVRYFTGKETTGFNLHIGGEGGGSLDAKFHVQLNQKVGNLAKTAAKYWCLDDGKVFFLDREGRIVPENMELSRIILPEVPSKESESEHQEEWVVKGRDYLLTLVQAGTVLHKEDLSKPQGEQWHDFTFDGRELNKELQESRKKKGEQQYDPSKETMDLIPSLNDLIQEGLHKKANQRQNLRCRVFEFVIYMICWTLFFIILGPETEFALKMNFIGQDLVRHLSNFTVAEKKDVGINSFLSVHSESQYYYWLTHPLHRFVRPSGLTQSNMAVLGAVAYVYALEKQAPVRSSDWTWCSADVTTAVTTQIDINSTNASDTVTTIAPATAPTPGPTVATNATTAANSTAPRLLSAVDQVDMVEQQTTTTSTQPNYPPVTGRRLKPCVPLDLQSCQNERVIEVLNAAKQDDHQIPSCTVQQPWLGFFFDFQKLSSSLPFSGINGRVSIYSGGELVKLNFSTADSLNNTLLGFQSSKFKQAAGINLVLFVYVPSLGGIHIFQMLMERTFSGSVVTSIQRYTLDVDPPTTSTITLYVIEILFLVMILLMEFRRILRWPKWKWNDEEKDHFSKATVLLIVLTTIVALSFGTYLLRVFNKLDKALKLNNQLTFTSKTMEELYRSYVITSVVLFLQLVCLVLFSALFLRYLLLYFPYLHTVTVMVRKVTKPLLYSLLLIGVAFSVVALVLYTMYGDYLLGYRNNMWIFMEMFRFGSGTVSDWHTLYRIWPITFGIVMIASLVLFKHLLFNLPLSIMQSHKKERDLFANYSYHHFWAEARSKKVREHGDSQKWEFTFNPALQGDDFRGREPWDASSGSRNK